MKKEGKYRTLGFSKKTKQNKTKKQKTKNKENDIKKKKKKEKKRRSHIWLVGGREKHNSYSKKIKQVSVRFAFILL